MYISVAQRQGGRSHNGVPQMIRGARWRRHRRQKIDAFWLSSKSVQNTAQEMRNTPDMKSKKCINTSRTQSKDAWKDLSVGPLTGTSVE